MGLKGGLRFLGLARRDQPVGDQALGVKLQGGFLLLDRLVHQGLGEHRLVALVVAEAAIAEDVDHHVALEFLAELGGDLGGVDHRFGVVAVDVEDRAIDDLGDIGRVGRRARVVRRRGEADLVVDDDVDGAAGLVALEAGEAEALGDHALPGEGGVAMHQHRDHRGAVVAVLLLLGPHLAQHHRVHRLQMRGIGGQRQVHLVAVELAVRRGPEMVFHIARAVDVLGLEAAALEFVEDRPVGLGHDVGEHAEAAAMGHAEDDLLGPERAAALDDLLHRRDHRLGPVEAEALGAHVLDLQELLETLGLDQLLQDRLAAHLGELDFLAVALDALLQPGFGLRVDQVHELEREGALVGALQQRLDLAHGGVFQPQHVVDEDRVVEIAVLEAEEPGVEFRMLDPARQLQRIEIGAQMPARAERADIHDGADRIEHRAPQFGLADTALGCGLALDLPGQRARVGHRIPVAVERRDHLAVLDGRPVGPRPGGAAGLVGHRRGVVAQGLEERRPGGIDRAGIQGVAGMELFDILGVVALEEGGGVELTVRALIVHFSAGRPFGPPVLWWRSTGRPRDVSGGRMRAARGSINHQLH